MLGAVVAAPYYVVEHIAANDSRFPVSGETIFAARLGASASGLFALLPARGPGRATNLRGSTGTG